MKLLNLFPLLFLNFIIVQGISAQELLSHSSLIQCSSFFTASNASYSQSKEIRLQIIAPLHKNSLPFAFIISGDGGWTNFDQKMAESIANKGFGVIGLDARKYFWKAKTPEQTTADVSSIIKHYQKLWNIKSFVLVGYSFGADIIPFIVNRLSPTLEKSLYSVLALSPDRYSDFEVCILNLLHLRRAKKYDVLAELKKIKTVVPVAFFGSEEDEVLAKHFADQGIKTIILIGNHHFNYNYESISMGLYEYMKP